MFFFAIACDLFFCASNDFATLIGPFAHCRISRKKRIAVIAMRYNERLLYKVKHSHKNVLILFTKTNTCLCLLRKRQMP